MALSWAQQRLEHRTAVSELEEHACMRAVLRKGFTASYVCYHMMLALSITPAWLSSLLGLGHAWPV
jgi:hypothetical protein